MTQQMTEQMIEFEKWKITYLEQQKKDRLLLRLDHEKVMQKQRLDHEAEIYKYKVEVEKMQQESRSTRKEKSPSMVYDEEDIIFNIDTLFGEGKDCNIGKLAKTAAWTASKNQADSLDLLLSSNPKYSEYKISILPTDTKSKKIRGLLHMLLWAHSVSARAARWPQAPDMELIAAIKNEILAKIGKFEAQSLQAVLDFLQSVWKEKISNSIDLDTTLVSEYIDNTCAQYLKEREYLEEVRTEKNPFLIAVTNKLIELDPDFNPAPVINYIKTIIQRERGGFSKSKAVAFYVSRNCYKNKIHPLFVDKYDKEEWTERHNMIACELQTKLMSILEPVEESVQTEYMKFENLRKERGVIDKVW